MVGLPFNAFAHDDGTVHAEYYKINWFDQIKYFVSNPFLAIQLIWDQPNIDSIYEVFVKYHNNYIATKEMPSNLDLSAFTIFVNDRVATKEYCMNLTEQMVINVITANIPYEKIKTYCDVPIEFDNIIKAKFS